MKKIIILFLILNFIFLPTVLAKSGHMKLLDVREAEDGTYEGGTADLYLEIKPGSGRVFLETFPLTKTDTQMSTRFAKAIACDTIGKYCDDVDFLYAITADSAIIAGPSAGSSIAVLTIAVLEDLKLDESIATTGTINSGGLIGPVGGLKAKIEAAKKAGLKKVLIPAGEIIANIDNKTIDLDNLSKELGIEIVEVSTLDDTVKHFTGKGLKQKYRRIEIDSQYTETMKMLAKDLCDRSNKLKDETAKLIYPINVTYVSNRAKNLTSSGREAFEKQTFYSSASYCFGANVEYSTLILLSKNLSKEEMLAEIENVKANIKGLRDKIDSIDKKTITDLEAYMVVKERLSDAQDSVQRTFETLKESNKTNNKAVRDLAYASERINSAYSWATFLGKNGKSFVLNKEMLRNSCQTKISEADERKQYVELYFPGTLGEIKKDIDKATEELKNENYEICLSMASKAKADVDALLSIFGVSESQYGSLLDRKLDIVKNNIAEQTSKGVFPILGYSYYEYANSLKNSDILSALLYSEYAIEFANLDIYFKESTRKEKRISIDNRLLAVFLAGVLAGAAAVSIIRIKKLSIKPKQNLRKVLPGKKR